MGRPSNAQLAERALSQIGDLPMVTYTPLNPGDPNETLWNRNRFRANVPTMVRDNPQGWSAAQMVEMAKTNPHFIVEGFEQAKGTPTVPETPEQYKMHAIGWIRLAHSSAEMSAKWRSEEELRVECGVGDDDIEYIQSIYKPRLAILKDAEKLAQSAVNE